MKKKVYLSLIEGQADQDVAMGLLDGLEFEELYINYHERMSEWTEESQDIEEQKDAVVLKPKDYASFASYSEALNATFDKFSVSISEVLNATFDKFSVSIELPDEPVGVEVVPGVYATWIGDHNDYKYKNVIKNLSEKGVLEWTEGAVCIPSERSMSGNLSIARSYQYLVCERKDGVYKYCMYTVDGFKEEFGYYGIRAAKSND